MAKPDRGESGGGQGACGGAENRPEAAHSNGSIVAKPGIETVADLKGKTIGVEEGFVCHLLLLKALELNGMAETDVTVKNTPTNNTPQVLADAEVDAIGAWQPNSGQALKVAPGSKAVFTSKDVPGLIDRLLRLAGLGCLGNRHQKGLVR